MNRTSETSNRDISTSISAEIDALRPEIQTFLQSLVQQPSLPGQEQGVQHLIAEKFRSLGLRVSILKSELAQLSNHPAFSDDDIPFVDRLNTVGFWESSDRDGRAGRSLILNGHVDVVPTGAEELWAFPPWSGIVENGKLHGRGSCDMKAGVTAAIYACQALRQLGFEPANNIILETVIGEESGGVGTLTTLLHGIRADAAIIMEPTRLRICPLQAGALSFRIRVFGHAIHASMKRFGVSAIEKFSLVLAALEQLDRQRHAEYQNPLFEHRDNVAPICIGTIRAGDWPSTVPDQLVAEGRLGVFPGESTATARKLLGDCLAEVSASDAWLKEHPPKLEWFEGQFEPGETPVGEPIIQCLMENHHSIFGADPVVQGVPYGSDLRLFTNEGKIPAVLYGPGDVAYAHTTEEFVPLEDVFLCARVLAETIVSWVGGSFRKA